MFTFSKVSIASTAIIYSAVDNVVIGLKMQADKLSDSQDDNPMTAKKQQNLPEEHQKIDEDCDAKVVIPSKPVTDLVRLHEKASQEWDELTAKKPDDKGITVKDIRKMCHDNAEFFGVESKGVDIRLTEDDAKIGDPRFFSHYTVKQFARFLIQKYLPQFSDRMSMNEAGYHEKEDTEFFCVLSSVDREVDPKEKLKSYFENMYNQNVNLPFLIILNKMHFSFHVNTSHWALRKFPGLITGVRELNKKYGGIRFYFGKDEAHELLWEQIRDGVEDQRELVATPLVKAKGDCGPDVLVALALVLDGMRKKNDWPAVPMEFSEHFKKNPWTKSIDLDVRKYRKNPKCMGTAALTKSESVFEAFKTAKSPEKNLEVCTFVRCVIHNYKTKPKPRDYSKKVKATSEDDLLETEYEARKTNPENKKWQLYVTYAPAKEDGFPQNELPHKPQQIVAAMKWMVHVIQAQKEISAMDLTDAPANPKWKTLQDIVCYLVGTNMIPTQMPSNSLSVKDQSEALAKLLQSKCHLTRPFASFFEKTDKKTKILKQVIESLIKEHNDNIEKEKAKTEPMEISLEKPKTQEQEDKDKDHEVGSDDFDEYVADDDDFTAYNGDDNDSGNYDDGDDYGGDYGDCGDDDEYNNEDDW